MWLYHQAWLLQQQLWLTCRTFLMTAHYAIFLQPQGRVRLGPARQHAAGKLCGIMMMPLPRVAMASLVVRWVPGSAARSSTGNSWGLTAEQWLPLLSTEQNRTPHKLRQRQQLQPWQQLPMQE
jgi:hypothetical protein